MKPDQQPLLPPMPARRPPFLAQTIMPAVMAWANSFVTLIIGFLSTEGTHRYPGQSLGRLVELIVLTLALYANLSAMVVFRTCVLIVAPLLRLLPRSWPVWYPPVTTVLGAGAGSCTIYCWMSLFLGKIILPDLHDRSMIPLTVAAGLAGTIFACLFAKTVRKISV